MDFFAKHKRFKAHLGRNCVDNIRPGQQGERRIIFCNDPHAELGGMV